MIIACCFFYSGHIRAATLEVNAAGGTPYTQIQDAINAAIQGVDDVFVHCGVYSENVVMRDQVNVTGAGAGCTIIDGAQNGSVVTMVDVSAPTRLEGFTIRNGLSPLGGGIYLEESAPTITRNVITDNAAIINGSVTGYGGGIHITARVTRDMQGSPSPVITGNVIRNNSAETFGGGIEVYSDSGSTISNNLIVNNTAVQAGGGIDVFISYPDITNNTITRNCLQGGASACLQGGGGIALTSSGISAIANNLIAWNEAGGGGGGVDLVGSTMNFDANDAFANLPLDYLGVADPTGSNGNISTDPLLLDEQPTFMGHQPRSDSPLLDAANAGLATTVDIRGIPRPLDGDGNGVAGHDIGARENEGISRLRFTSGSDLIWDPSVNVLALFNLYRGSYQHFLSTGEYTQDIGTVAGADRQCGLATPTASDLNSPPSGELYFYLAVVSDAGEGTLGFDSSPTERPFINANRCP